MTTFEFDMPFTFALKLVAIRQSRESYLEGQNRTESEQAGAWIQPSPHALSGTATPNQPAQDPIHGLRSDCDFSTLETGWRIVRSPNLYACADLIWTREENWWPAPTTGRRGPYFRSSFLPSAMRPWHLWARSMMVWELHTIGVLCGSFRLLIHMIAGKRLER